MAIDRPTPFPFAHSSSLFPFSFHRHVHQISFRRQRQSNTQQETGQLWGMRGSGAALGMQHQHRRRSSSRQGAQANLLLSAHSERHRLMLLLSYVALTELQERQDCQSQRHIYARGREKGERAACVDHWQRMAAAMGGRVLRCRDAHCDCPLSVVFFCHTPTFPDRSIPSSRPSTSRWVHHAHRTACSSSRQQQWWTQRHPVRLFAIGPSCPCFSLSFSVVSFFLSFLFVRARMPAVPSCSWLALPRPLSAMRTCAR